MIKSARKPKETRGRRPGQSEAYKRLLAQMKAKGYVDPATAALLACVARPTLYGWIRRGLLHPENVHGTLWISVAELSPYCPASVPAAG